jgi:hypothetical protein
MPSLMATSLRWCTHSARTNIYLVEREEIVERVDTVCCEEWGGGLWGF